MFWGDGPGGLGYQVVRLSGFFLAGMLLWCARGLRPRLDLAVLATVGSLVTYVWLLPIPVAEAILPLPLAYGLLSLGALLPVRLGARNDVSYGVYIYAFPVQQAVYAFGGHALGVVGFAMVSVVLTLPLAWASWLLVERPALRWGRRKPRAPAKQLVRGH